MKTNEETCFFSHSFCTFGCSMVSSRHEEEKKTRGSWIRMQKQRGNDFMLREGLHVPRIEDLERKVHVFYPYMIFTHVSIVHHLRFVAL